MPLEKKGFFVSSPLMGAILFLIAAGIAVTMAGENDARISVARSSDASGDLQFIAEAIKADSYDVLLQGKIEDLTVSFTELGHFDVNTNENWRQSLRNNLLTHYTKTLGETLGLDMQVYKKAYGEMPSMKMCDIESVLTSRSGPSIEDSQDPDDEAVMVRAYSFGEQIICTTRDPERTVRVDIAGRRYRINVRIPNFYNVAIDIISKAKTALNSGVDSVGIPEPIATWEAPKWSTVNKVDNMLLEVGSVDLDGIVDKWVAVMTWLSGRIISMANTDLREAGNIGMKLTEFEVTEDEANEGLYKLTDFDLSCVVDGIGEFRNCMPFRALVKLGDTECVGMETVVTKGGCCP